MGHPGVQAQVPEAPRAGRDLTVRDIVDVLAEFDVRHADQQPFFQQAYGATVFDVFPPQVWIFNQGDLAGKRSTVIHELIHIKCRSCGEAEVRAEEERQYREVYAQ